MGKKKKKPYGVNHLIKDAELLSKTSCDELKAEIMKDINQQVQLWRMEQVRLWKWKDCANIIANWAENRLQEDDKNHEKVRIFIESIWLNKGYKMDHFVTTKEWSKK